MICALVGRLFGAGHWSMIVGGLCRESLLSGVAALGRSWELGREHRVRLSWVSSAMVYVCGTGSGTCHEPPVLR